MLLARSDVLNRIFAVADSTLGVSGCNIHVDGRVVTREHGIVEQLCVGIVGNLAEQCVDDKIALCVCRVLLHEHLTLYVLRRSAVADCQPSLYLVHAVRKHLYGIGIRIADRCRPRRVGIDGVANLILQRSHTALTADLYVQRLVHRAVEIVRQWDDISCRLPPFCGKGER